MNQLNTENSTAKAHRAFAGTLSCDRCGKLGSTRQTFLNEGDDGERYFLCYNCALLRAIQLQFEGTPIVQGAVQGEAVHRLRAMNAEEIELDDGVIGQMLRWVTDMLPDELERVRAESERL